MFLLYVFYNTFNFLSIFTNLIALLLMPSTQKLCAFIEDPFYKICLIMLACFLSGALIIWNQTNVRPFYIKHDF
jgi:hypothetical protein